MSMRNKAIQKNETAKTLTIFHLGISTNIWGAWVLCYDQRINVRFVYSNLIREESGGYCVRQGVALGTGGGAHRVSVVSLSKRDDAKRNGQTGHQSSIPVDHDSYYHQELVAI
jgi:hypothetical protein